ncbi:MAG TPA: dihydroorotase family protein [Candidatus Krumholzibacteriaceae bacterium]|nr:dihydroorotase family protein [Candidatus Krumholzibacteriaceae bacterium]
MPVDLVVYNGKISIQNAYITAGVAVDEGKIVKVAKKTNLPPASEKIDVQGNFILPGLIDVHTHLRDQKQAYEEDFTTGTAAAAAGGITLCADMPNNEPVTMDAETLEERMRVAADKILTNVAFYSAFPTSLHEISRTVNQGAVSFKLFMTKQIGGADIDSDDALEKAFQQTQKSHVPVAVHAEDKALLESAQKKLIRTGQGEIDAYLKAHPPLVEEKAVHRVLGLVEKTEAQVHFCHISSKLGLDAVRRGKESGLPVSCEVTAHHLLLSSSDLKRYGTIALCDPPVRDKEDVEALWEALGNGLIDIIASDHAPHLLKEKEAESIWDVKPGFPNLETIISLILNEINKDRLSIADLIRLMAEKPAEIFHLEGIGRLEKEYNADITIVDMHREHRIDASKFYSKAKYSPFDGWKLKGKPIKTFVNGQLAMEEGEIVAKPGTGQIIGWKH